MTQNLAPTSGTLTTLPIQGYVLHTMFQISAEQWVDPKVPDEDYPLSFSFGYVDFSGFPKLLVSGSLLPSISTMLPPGTDAVGCLPTESLCRRLQLTVSVADALYAWNQPASKTYVRIDTMEPEQIRETIEREMSIAQALKESKSGSDLLSKCATIADTMNDATINFEFYEISIQDTIVSSV